LIPLPSVSFQCKTFQPMLVKGKMLAGGGGRPPPLQKNLPHPADGCRNRHDSKLGEGRVRAD